ncbi:HAD domain-containing protein [Cupriavidus sp. WKF15]|uniref:HAD domain-containing protein n=1 Tax=Cupriavidus sp. WKF15 TaxID=3032282 RepID=UPI0023E15D83|nr:HAD domain-containing protein [Cupriavidus sp. WKF15]WER45597.1 HAD domain-containing protein [Cupriavidus sp. WKF15]
MILFLDYDGVLHPDAAYYVQSRKGSYIELRAEGALFMWMPILEEILSPYSEVRIVLSTSWVRELGFSKARGFLSPWLQSRVIGGTWHSKMSQHREGSHRISDRWSELTRYQQIARYISTKKPGDSWIAIDDDIVGWDRSVEHRLVPTDPSAGLSDPATQELLIERLDACAHCGDPGASSSN